MRPGKDLAFIGSDANRREPALKKRFTTALAEAGFGFPVQATFGRVSILKPFDAGFLLLDADGALFHLKRVDAAPSVAQVPLPDGVSVRHVKVIENKRREYLGLLLADHDRLYLIGEDDYRLTPLPLPGYDPDRMALKVIFNPLYRTAIFSDRQTIHAVAMDRAFQPIDRYRRTMAMAEPRAAERIWQAIVLFSLDLHDPDSRYLVPALHLHGVPKLIGIAVALPLAWLVLRRRMAGLALVALTGIYGLIAIALFPPEPEASSPAPAGAADAAVADSAA